MGRAATVLAADHPEREQYRADGAAEHERRGGGEKSGYPAVPPEQRAKGKRELGVAQADPGRVHQEEQQVAGGETGGPRERCHCRLGSPATNPAPADSAPAARKLGMVSWSGNRCTARSTCQSTTPTAATTQHASNRSAPADRSARAAKRSAVISSITSGGGPSWCGSGSTGSSRTRGPTAIVASAATARIPGSSSHASYCQKGLNIVKCRPAGLAPAQRR